MPIAVICKQCGKEFQASPSLIKKGKGKYCSKKCYNLYINEKGLLVGKNNPHYNRMEIICKQCGKIFDVTQSQIKRGRGVYCSKECKCKSYRVDCECQYCGKLFIAMKSTVDIGEAKYCSRKCHYEHRTESGAYLGEKSPRYNQIERRCKYCGKNFNTHPSFIKDNGGKYCSRQCWIDAQGSIDYCCEICGKKYKRTQWEMKKGWHIYCSRSCAAKAYSDMEKYKGKNHNNWKGGYFPYYGENWVKIKLQKFKKSKYVSEMSKENGTILHVHHIVPLRIFVNKYIDLCLKPYLGDISFYSLKILPYDIIPSLIFSEANSKENLIVLTKGEHKRYEGMPLGFFTELKHKNNSKL
jgi:hypothetical protein